MADDPDRRYETPEILSDSPLTNAEDKAHFHFDDFAAMLARLIAHKNTRTPLAIGVSGPWGSGKTTLLRRVQRQLDQTASLSEKSEPAAIEFVNPDETPEKDFRVCRTVWFNAWKYADEDALLVALVRSIGILLSFIEGNGSSDEGHIPVVGAITSKSGHILWAGRNRLD